MTFQLITKDPVRKTFRQAYAVNAWNLRNAFNNVSGWIYNHFIKKNIEHSYLLVAYPNGRPLFCSNKDMKSSECKQMLAWGMLTYNYAKADEKLFGTTTIFPEDTARYTYIALLKDTSKPDAKFEAIPLNSTNYNSIINRYKELAEWTKKDSSTVAALTHSSIRGFRDYKSRVVAGTNKNQITDVLELVAEYMMDKSENYGKAECTEEQAKAYMKKALDEDRKAAFDKIKGTYKGGNSALAFREHVQMVSFDWTFKNLRVRYHYNRADTHMNINNRLNEMARNYKNQNWPNEDKLPRTTLIYGRDNAPIWCSDGEFSNEKCTMALGWAATKTRQFIPSRKVIDTKMNGGSEDYYYVGYFREKEGGKVIRTNFTRNYAKSVVEYNAMWKSRKYESALMGHTAVHNFWQWRSKWSAAGKNR